MFVGVLLLHVDFHALELVKPKKKNVVVADVVVVDLDVVAAVAVDLDTNDATYRPLNVLNGA